MMFDDVEVRGMPRKTKYVLSAVAIVGLCAIVTALHFTTEEHCYANVVTSTDAKQINPHTIRATHIEFTTKIVPCDCLPGSRDFWTIFHSCPKQFIKP
jgi:hypothetical protein